MSTTITPSVPPSPTSRGPNVSQLVTAVVLRSKGPTVVAVAVTAAPGLNRVAIVSRVFDDSYNLN